jgi:hypothetical protein
MVDVVADGAEHVTVGDCRRCRCHQNRLIIELARHLANDFIPYLLVITIFHWLSAPSTDPAVRYRWDASEC